MEDIHFEKSVFAKAVLAGVFSGFFATCTALLYNVIYRGISHYNPSEVINISSIIFGTFILAVVAGVILALFIRYTKIGITLFRLLFLILLGLLAFVAFRNQSGTDLPMYDGFTGLLFGIDIIFFIFIVILIPYFYKHHELFLD
ncbi:MAG: hypothetical protein ABJB05_06655 [Parafilimonas sp.]